MATYQEMQKQLIAALTGGAGAGEAVGTTPLYALVDALPYYGDANFESAHRGALANLLEVNMPNSGITPQAREDDGDHEYDYAYTGPYSGYRDAFFHGVTQTGAASAVAAQAAAVNGGINGGFWGNYGVTALSDAIRSTLGFTLDSNKLSNDLSSDHNTFLPALTASVLGVYQTGFAPTANALAAIPADQRQAALSQLTSDILGGHFTANVNKAISMGGDSTSAATWFLYQLWVTLKALGAEDVDGLIDRFKSAGLDVPAEVGPRSWWTGGYASWYVALSGSDVKAQAASTISGGLPEQKTLIVYRYGLTQTWTLSVGNGYSTSLCYWGSLNWYNPPSSSCFGAGTGVLMEDGSVKPIEYVRVGDVVRSSLGPRKVVLVESPKRGGRSLHRVDDLELFCTSGHPFRAAPGSGPARVAVDPWALLDTSPTAVAAGVGTLRPGVMLAGLEGEVRVSEVKRIDDAGDPEERVYDLLLESWEKGQASYYVGGPRVFVAADPETSDPLHDLPSTLAVVTALEAALPSCRAHVADPVHALSAHVASLPLTEVVARGREAAWTVGEGKMNLPAIPGPDRYMRDGVWDAHASMLEAHLVRSFGRRLRRELATGWRTGSGHAAEGDHLAILVHDVELLDDAPPAGAALAIELRLRGASPVEDLVHRVCIEKAESPRWHLVLDRTVDFGQVFFDGRPMAVIGTLLVDGRDVGHFRVAVHEGSRRGASEEHFLFGPGGAVIGRVAVEQRRVSGRALMHEQHAARAWNRRRTLAMAMDVGRRLGRRLAAAVEDQNAK